MKVNIIGDIHGRFETMKELLSKLPEADKTIIIGDAVDKGNKSFAVITYIIKHKKEIEMIAGNHEILFAFSTKKNHKDLPHLKLIKRNDFRNGYLMLKEGLRNEIKSLFNSPEKRWEISNSISKYFYNLDLEIEIDNLYISHAPYTMHTEQMKNFEDNFYKIFTSHAPKIISNKFAVFGHTEKPRLWKNNGEESLKITEIPKKNGKGKIGEAIGIDGSPKILMGIHIDSITLDYEIFAVEGMSEWYKSLGSKYKMTPSKRKNIYDQFERWGIESDN